MTATTVVLLRHGRTAYNAAMRLQGQVDIELDEVGRWQAEQGASALASAHRATIVVASDLSRAADTGRAYAERVGADLVLDPRVRERGFGQWEGLSRPEIEDGWPQEYAAWRRGDDPLSVGAEAKIDVAQRMQAAILEHAAALPEGATLVVASHGAAITLGITALLGLDAAHWRGISGLHNVHWSHLHRSTEGATPAWRLVAHNVGAGYPVDEWNAGPDWNLEPGQEPA